MLQVLNSQTRTKEEFKPLDPTGQRVTFYTCGPTVYDSLHLGHARAAIVPDLARRYLEYKGYQVRYVSNFTDVDDKIIKRAVSENRNWRELTSVYIEEYHRIMLSLGVKPADMYPRATDHIDDMVEIVQRLVDGGNAYVAADGDVYFDTKSYANYGNLSKRNLEAEEAGRGGRINAERLAVKKNHGDFILWKLRKNDKGELAEGGDLVPNWDSPWGAGRPGWHLECSAMSKKYLGVPFDLHGGGKDLLFPHHEDEKAQTECAFCNELDGKESVKYWVHNEFITVNDGKMGKSEGNAQWLRQMIWPEGPNDPMAIRMFTLSSHYRSPIEFDPDTSFDESKARLDRLYTALEGIARVLKETTPAEDAEHPLIKTAAEAKAKFIATMDDDFNSAGALGAIFELVSAVNPELKNDSDPNVAAGLKAAQATLHELLTVLGFRTERGEQGGSDSMELVDLLLQTRLAARKAKQYALADQIRDQLTELGYVIKDLPSNKWEVHKS